MLKSTPPKQTPKGRVKKYLGYREAWSRIRIAQKNGHYLEAVTLEESIICDRLISYLVSNGALARPVSGNNHPSFSSLIGLWKRTEGTPISEGGFSNLQESVDTWRILRNKVVHGIVKSYPDTEPDDITSFLEEAERAAEEGRKLARAVSKWREKAKKQMAAAGSN